MDPKIQELLRLYEGMSLFDRVHVASFIPGSFYKDINSKPATAAAYRVLRDLWESDAAESIYARLLVLLQKEGPGAAKVAVDGIVAKKTSQGAVVAIARLTDAWVRKGVQQPNTFGAAFVATARSDRSLLRGDVKEEILKIGRAMELPPILPGNIVPAFQVSDPSLDFLRKIGLMTVRIMGAFGETTPSGQLIDQAVDLYVERSGVTRFTGDVRGEPTPIMAFEVGTSWALSGFPLIQVNDELAALFMGGDVPETIDASTFKLPWSSFFLQIPAGLRPPRMPLHALGVARTEHGAYLTVADHRAIPTILMYGSFEELLKRLEQELPLLYRFLIGMLLYMNTPRTLERIEGETKERRKLKEARGGNELPSVWAVRLSRPVKIDCRQWVKDYYERGGHSPSVQSLIRGHWKRQPFGAGRSERKWTFISPYWRGKPTDPIAVREIIINEH
jgi:hypothetical protein